MLSTFEVGDVVRLKSGGPMMRVTRFRRDKDGVQKVECVWFEGPMEVEELFPPAILDLMRHRIDPASLRFHA